MKRTNKKQKVFTIIELVVVILLLGILTATALPRFMDISSQAHGAVNDAIQGSMQASTSMFHAAYIAQGQPSSGTGITAYTPLKTNAAGWPVVDAAVDVTAAHCATIYQQLIQSSGAPTVAANATATAIPTVAEINAATTDYVSYVLPTERICRYAYTAEGGVDSGTVKEITYDTASGTVAYGTSGTLN